MTKMLLVDVKNKEVKPVECNGLDDYYKYIGCRCIDIIRRKIGTRYFEIIVDDEGLFAEEPIVSAIDTDFNQVLVGNLLIAGGEVTEDGELTDITEAEIGYISGMFKALGVLLIDY